MTNFCPFEFVPSLKCEKAGGIVQCPWRQKKPFKGQNTRFLLDLYVSQLQSKPSNIGLTSATGVTLYVRGSGWSKKFLNMSSVVCISWKIMLWIYIQSRILTTVFVTVRPRCTRLKRVESGSPVGGWYVMIHRRYSHVCWIRASARYHFITNSAAGAGWGTIGL